MSTDGTTKVDVTATRGGEGSNFGAGSFTPGYQGGLIEIPLKPCCGAVLLGEECPCGQSSLELLTLPMIGAPLRSEVPA